MSSCESPQILRSKDDHGVVSKISRTPNRIETLRTDAEGHQISRVIFHRKAGRVVSSDVFDARNALIATERFKRNANGTLQESSIYSPDGTLITRTVFGPDSMEVFDATGSRIAPGNEPDVLDLLKATKAHEEF